MNIESLDGWISPDRMWAAIPYGKKFMTVHNGEQISVHNTVDTAKKFIEKQTQKRK